MSRVHLLTVEDTFLLEANKTSILVIHPCFPAPLKEWENWEGEVTVVMPDGCESEFPARLGLAHFNISDPKAPLSERWKVVLSFMNRSKDEVPIGSIVMVPGEIREALALPGGETIARQDKPDPQI